jgi:hypothetical protein
VTFALLGRVLPVWIVARLKVWRLVVWRPWVGVVTAVYTLSGVADFVRDKLLPAPWHKAWDKYYVLPNLSWQTWVIVGLMLSVLFVLEGSYQVVSKSQPDDHRAKLIALLGDLLAIGQRYVGQNVAQGVAMKWGDTTGELIGEAFGPLEAQQFGSSAGYGSYGSSQVRAYVEGRLRRLGELTPRISSLPIAENFDPAKWSARVSELTADRADAN